MSAFLGRLTVTSLRLCSRAPWTTSCSAAAITPSVALGFGRTCVRFRGCLAPLQTRGRDGDPDGRVPGFRGEKRDRVLRGDGGQAFVPRPRDRADELVASRE